jgi:amino acid transporter
MSNHKELDSEASNSSSGSNGNQIKLKKEINLFTGCAIIIGNIVGSGIFITSKGVLEKSISPGLALIVWLVSGIFSLIGAYCYTELGTLIQTSGGDYAYINQSYGRLGAFLYNFMMTFVTIPCLNAISGITVATYIIRLIYVDCDPPLLLIRIISALTILFLCFLNMSNIKLVSKIQAAFTVTKMAALLLIIFMGFYTFIIGPIKTDELLQSWFDFKDVKLNGLAMAFYNGLYSFSGWNCLNFLTEELKSPSKYEFSYLK